MTDRRRGEPMTEQQTTTGQHTTWIADDELGGPTLAADVERLRRAIANLWADVARHGGRQDAARSAETGPVSEYGAGVDTETTVTPNGAQGQVDAATNLTDAARIVRDLAGGGR